jgi:O-antigen ligase
VIRGADAPTRLAAVAACGAAVVVPLVYLPLAEAPFRVPKLAALEIAAALGYLALALRMASGRATWERLFAWGAALVLATTVLSWAVAARGPAGAPYAVPAVARWAALFGIAGAAAVLARDAGWRQTLLEAATWTAAVVSAVGLWQHLELAPLPIPVISAPGSTFGNRNLAGEAIALCLPLGLGAVAGAEGRGTRLALIGALGLSLVYLAATRTRGAWLGAGAGALTAVLLLRPRLTRAAALAALGAVALAATVALLPGPTNPRDVGDTKRRATGVEVAQASFDPQSIALRTRFGLWRRTLAMWGEHPVWGVGPGNWPVFFPRYAEPGAAADGVLTAKLAPRQAHDDLLERAAETGLVGLLALVALAAVLVILVRRRLRSPADRPSTAAAAGALIALAGTGATGFPLEMPATLALGGLALGLTAAGGTEAPRRAAWIALPLAAALILGAAWRAQGELRGSIWLRRADRAFAGRTLEGATRALPLLERAAAAAPSAFAVHFTKAQVLLRLRRPAESEEAARRALAIESFSPYAWAALAAAQLEHGDAPAARMSAARATALLNDFPAARAVETATAGK